MLTNNECLELFERMVEKYNAYIKGDMQKLKNELVQAGVDLIGIKTFTNRNYGSMETEILYRPLDIEEDDLYYRHEICWG